MSAEKRILFSSFKQKWTQTLNIGILKDWCWSFWSYSALVFTDLYFFFLPLLSYKWYTKIQYCVRHFPLWLLCFLINKPIFLIGQLMCKPPSPLNKLVSERPFEETASAGSCRAHQERDLCYDMIFPTLNFEGVCFCLISLNKAAPRLFSDWSMIIVFMADWGSLMWLGWIGVYKTDGCIFLFLVWKLF